MEDIITKPVCTTDTNMCCGCVGYAYVPMQRLNNTFTTAQSILRGTLFPELELTIDEYGKVCKQGGGPQC
ncbi:MAG: spore coat associated protein CotJA [Clostridia bacterium]|nr:spore coat associated protein CotJA [Clostridia bacterium]